MADESPHARDLGYLERFIQKLEGEAQTLPNGPKQQALRLLGDQRSQWTTIMGLLDGSMGTAAPHPVETPTPHERPVAPFPVPTPPAPTSPTAPATANTQAAAGRGLTVGSLIGYP